MQADKNILQMKYARIVRLFADQIGIPYEDALEFFYASDTYHLISSGIADMHCLSDEYLADEISQEWDNTSKEHSNHGTNMKTDLSFPKAR